MFYGPYEVMLYGYVGLMKACCMKPKRMPLHVMIYFFLLIGLSCVVVFNMYSLILPLLFAGDILRNWADLQRAATTPGPSGGGS